MWIEEQSNGKLRYVERYKEHYTGKYKRAYELIERDTPQGRKKAATALRLKIEKLVHIRPQKEKVTFGEVYQNFYSSWSLGVKQSTIYSTKNIDRIILKKIPNDYLISKIDRRFLQKIFDDLLSEGRSHNYVKKVKWKLNRIFKYALRMDYIDVNEMIHVELPKEILTAEQAKKKKEKFLDQKEFKLFAQNLREEVYRDYRVKKYLRIAIVLYLTGMRYGELAGLNISKDIDFKKKTIHIQHTFNFRTKQRTTPKTKGSDRIIEVSDTVLKNIQEQLAENIRAGFETDYLFINTLGYPTTPERVIGAFKRHGQKAGIEKNITTHIFRHSHISLLAEIGIPLPAIMERVGHSDSKTTLEVYSHVTLQMTTNLAKKLNEVKLF